MWFLTIVLLATTLLVAYAGYLFLVVDKRQQEAVLSDPELYEALDEKTYDFELPEQIDTYEDLRQEEQPDKRTLPLALLERAKADIPRIEQLEKDHPRMARLHAKGLLPMGVWEQLLDAEAMMDTEVNSVQAEAERLQKGWGAGVFSQAYQMLRKDREEEVRRQQMERDLGKLSMTFTKPSGGKVSVAAEGRKVSQQTQLKIRDDGESAPGEADELSVKSSVEASLTTGTGDDARTFSCEVPELTLDAEQEKQWKQIGSDPTGLRLQVKFIRKSKGAKTGFVVNDVRATIPDTPAPTPTGA